MSFLLDTDICSAHMRRPAKLAHRFILEDSGAWRPAKNAPAFLRKQMPTNAKKKAVLDRMKRLEEAISKGREYLESGKHAEWPGFRPLFAAKVKDGKRLPPHKDWVKNVFLPRRESALRQAEKALARLT